MELTAEDFYLLFANHNFKRVTEDIKEDFSGMYFVLKILDDAGQEMSAGDISEIFGVSTARTAVILSTLKMKGLINKTKHSLDARKTIVTITNKGKELLNNRKEILFGKINYFLGKLNSEEKNTFYNLLKKLLIDEEDTY